MAEPRASRFRRSGTLFGLVFIGACACGGSSEGSGRSGGGTNGGAGMVSYAACSFGSGVGRTLVAKRDPARDRCVVVILSLPGSETLGLTLPMGWGVESAFFSTPAATDCVMRLRPTGGVPADSGTGTVTIATGFVVDVDVTLHFPGDVSEELEAIRLDASPGCSL